MRIPIAALVLATLAACGKDAGVNAAYFGKSVAPPKGLAKLRPGMTRDEVKAATPDIKEGTGIHEGDWFVPSGSDDVQLEVEFDDDVVQDLIVKAKTTKLEAILTEAWGAPKKEVDRFSKEEQSVWLDEAAGWRAQLSCLKRMCFLYFRNYQPLTAAFFGKTPVPPGELAKLRVEMPLEEAKKLVSNQAVLDRYVPAGPDDVSIIAQVSSQTSKVSSVRLMLPTTAKALLVEAWGPGIAAKDSIDRPSTVWFDAATGWRATWEDESIGDSGSLEFTNYLPIPAILGESGDGLGLFPTPVLGLTADELAKAYPANWLADDKVLQMPPAAWGAHWIRVNTTFDEAGKLTAVRFGLPYKAEPGAKAELLAAFEKRWGAPTAGDEYGTPLMIFPTTPKVVIKDDTISNEWDISYGER